MRKYMLLVMCLFMIAACDKQPTTPIAVDKPSADFLNNPLDGPHVYHLQLGYSVCWTDPTNLLRVCNATVPLGTASNRDPDCGLQSAIAGSEHQHVFTGADLAEMHANDKGDVWITVRDMTQAGVCFGRKLVAEGPGFYHYVDNDVYFGASDGWNAWGWNAHGVLTTPEGTKVRYLGSLRGVERNFEVKTIQQDVRLIPMP